MISALGSFCHRNRTITLVLWLGIILAGVLSAGAVFDRMGSVTQITPSESAHAYQILDDHSTTGDGFSVIITGDAAAATRATAEAAHDVAALPGVASVSQPLPAADGQALLVTFVLTKEATDSDSTSDFLDPAIDRFERIQQDVPSVDVGVTGGTAVDDQVNQEVQSQLQTAEVISLPATLVVLAIVFGGLIAAAVPVLAAIATIAGSFAVMLAFTAFFDIDSTAMTLVTLMGLALSIDYGLLLVARHREEHAAGRKPDEAIRRTWATAGRTVAFSGLTVAGALCGLLVIDQISVQSMAVAGIAAALLAVLTALSLTAVLLRLGGRRVSARVLRRSPRPIESGGFYRLARFGQRRPALVIGGTVAVLLILATPLLSMRSHLPSMESLPRELPAVAAYDEIAEHYGAAALDDPAARVVAESDPLALQQWADQWASDPRVVAVGTAEPVGPAYSTVTITTAGDVQDAASFDLVGELRAADAPFNVWVAGSTGSVLDLEQSVIDGIPLALVLVAGIMFILMWLATGSVVIPIKALVMNVLSLGATLGVMIAVFQLGWGADVLDTITLPGMPLFTVLMVCAFGFGLAMDYEVFLLSRVKENVDQGMDTDDAVAHGLQSTGRIITCAALLMMICFSGFAAAGISQIEQIGLGLMVAVLIDATLVRCLLVPATMSVLGRWNWWSPLRRPDRSREPVPTRERAADQRQPDLVGVS